MSIEIERKFLVTGTEWRHSQGVRLRQGYLSRDEERTVRVRLTGDQAFLTIKGKPRAASRLEFEYEIPVADALSLLNLCDGPPIDKIRYTSSYKGCKWEVDEFLGENAGLIVAEVELETADQSFERPDWLGREVTDDLRYFNSNLACRPYSTWSEDR